MSAKVTQKNCFARSQITATTQGANLGNSG